MADELEADLDWLLEEFKESQQVILVEWGDLLKDEIQSNCERAQKTVERTKSILKDLRSRC